MHRTMVALALVLFAQTPRPVPKARTFMGHTLGESYEEALSLVRSTKDMSISEAGKCVTTSVESNVDQPNECFSDQHLSDAIAATTESRSTHFVTFDFVNGKLIRIDAAGCASGISQVRLLEERFGRYAAVMDMPYRNTTGSLLFNKKWDWWLPTGEHLYVLEDFGSLATCGGTGVNVVFEKPTKGKAKAVNPY